MPIPATRMARARIAAPMNQGVLVRSPPRAPTAAPRPDPYGPDESRGTLVRIVSPGGTTAAAPAIAAPAATAGTTRPSVPPERVADPGGGRGDLVVHLEVDDPSGHVRPSSLAGRDGAPRRVHLQSSGARWPGTQAPAA